MPLKQPLPGTWSSQVVVNGAQTADIAFNDYEISNNGMHWNSGKVYYGMPFPFIRFYFNNQSTGTAFIKVARASDNVVLLQTSLGVGSGASIATDGSFYRQFVLPNDNQNGLTFSLTQLTASMSVSIVLEGLTDSGLLPELEIETQPAMRTSGPAQRRILPGPTLGPGYTAPTPGQVVPR
tara:strand:- start:3500 stop:4039 length:540 start_codon:yes stop_codon:yes gene_type:complete